MTHETPGRPQPCTSGEPQKRSAEDAHTFDGMTCSTCDFPMVWSTTRQERWCAVYGRHPERFRNVMVNDSPISAVIRLDAERLKRRKAS